MNKIFTYCGIGVSLGLLFLGNALASVSIADVHDVFSTTAINQSSSNTVTFTPTFTNVKHIKLEFHTTNFTDYSPVSTTDVPNLAGATFNFGTSSLWTDVGGISGNITTTIGTNSIIISRTDGGPYTLPALSRTLTIDGLINPSFSGTLYMTISTYTTDGQLTGGLPTSAEKGFAATQITDSVQVSGFIGTSFYFGIDDSNVLQASNTSDSISSGDAAVRAALAFGTLGTNVLPVENPTSGAGRDGNKLTISTNSSKGYIITLSDDSAGFSLPGMTAVDRAQISNDNGVIQDFGQEIVDGSLPGSSFGSLQSAILGGAEAFTFSVTSGSSASLALGTYYSLKNSSTTPVKIAEFFSATPSEHTYILDYFATKNTNTPGGTYSDTLTYTAVPAL